MGTIPAGQIVDVIPGVLSAGGNALVMNGMILTQSNRIPTGTVQSFSGSDDVGDFFGPASKEAGIADVYFGGFIGSAAIPGSILFTQYNSVAVAAYLRGGDVSAALTLTQLQALTGTLSVVMDGYTHTSDSFSLSSATSYSSAASLIQTALDATEPTEASFTASIGATFTASGSGTNLTVSAVAYGYISPGDGITGTGVPSNTKIVSQTSGTAGGTGVYVTDNATTSSGASLVGTSNVLNVSVVASGTLSVGQTFAGSGVTGTPIITALGTGEGQDGTYVFSGAQQEIVPPESMTSTPTAPVVTFDSVSGAFLVASGVTGAASTAAFATGSLAIPLLLTSATGAVLSQGAAAATPGTFMTALAKLTQNWATFMTAFDPDGGSGNGIKLAFSEWTSQQDNRYGYVCWDDDASPTVTVPATGSLGYLIAQAGYSGTCLIYEPNDQNVAAFVCGTAASIDFTETNGRITFAFKGQSGIIPGVTDASVASNLIANGYNFYGAYAAANQNFMFFNNGSVSGPYLWFDSFINQIWLNNALQLAGMVLLTSVKSIPYNQPGYALVESAFVDPITAAVNFGAIDPGVALSALQAQQVNSAANSNIAPTLSTRGWYLQIAPTAAQVRAARGSPPCTLWYTDGGSVQKITLNSIEVQ